MAPKVTKENRDAEAIAAHTHCQAVDTQDRNGTNAGVPLRESDSSNSNSNSSDAPLGAPRRNMRRACRDRLDVNAAPSQQAHAGAVVNPQKQANSTPSDDPTSFDTPNANSLRGLQEVDIINANKNTWQVQFASFGKQIAAVETRARPHNSNVAARVITTTTTKSLSRPGATVAPLLAGNNCSRGRRTMSRASNCCKRRGANTVGSEGYQSDGDPGSMPHAYHNDIRLGSMPHTYHSDIHPDASYGHRDANTARLHGYHNGYSHPDASFGHPDANTARTQGYHMPLIRWTLCVVFKCTANLPKISKLLKDRRSFLDVQLFRGCVLTRITANLHKISRYRNCIPIRDGKMTNYMSKGIQLISPAVVTVTCIYLTCTF